MLVAGALAGVVGVGAAYAVAGDEDYEVQFVMPSAAQLIDGAPVWVEGQQAGNISGLRAEDGKAIVTVAVSDEYAPLHEGTTSRVEWQSVLGERVVAINPGPQQNPTIPSGAMYEAESGQMEVDQVLNALDEPTRKRLQSLLQGLAETTDGREQAMRQTLKTAGPTVQALGQILEAVGRDGPAIRDLVTQLRSMSKALASQHGQLSDSVSNLTRFTGTMAEQQQQLKKGLAELPPTLDVARDTLDDVPKAVDATTPLLSELGPVSQKLGSVSRDLSPVLKDLRPSVAQLRPTLEATQLLLNHTPGLLDAAHGTFPRATAMMRQYAPAVYWLRPYTPELVGWLHNWGQNFAGYDSQGHFWSAGLSPGATGNNNQPSGGAPPHKVEDPPPGDAVGQPWTDAHGSRMR